MQVRNTKTAYGLISILLHWLMAVLLIGLYLLGDYMVDLSYYNPWYKSLPELHKSIGMVVAMLLLLRLVWNYSQRRPDPVSSDGAPILERLAKLGHLALYGLMVAMVVSGYLISTAKGHGIYVFDFIEIPAVLAVDNDRGKLAEKIHEYATLGFMLLVIGHALAALIHHLYFKDKTLARMVGKA